MSEIAEGISAAEREAANKTRSGMRGDLMRAGRWGIVEKRPHFPHFPHFDDGVPAEGGRQAAAAGVARRGWP
jgi:hypothetical protein